MDDLDHSMDICEDDWLSFFEESEQCCLLQASLACPDSSGLSDADDPDTTQPYGPIKEHKARAECKEHGVVEEEVSIVQCSADVDGKGVSDPKSEPSLDMKGALGGDSMTCAEKERWFVTVNDKPPQKLMPPTVPVIKKKRKQKKICKVDWMNKHKANTCDNIDILKPGKLSEQKCSKTNTNSLETDINSMYIKSSSKGETLNHLDEANTSESILVKMDTNQVKSSDTMSSQEIHCESAQTQLNTDLISIGVSCKETTFALQHTSEPKEIECDTCNGITKGRKSLDTVFIEKKDRDVSSDISQTKLTMDLTCIQDSSVNHLDDSNSTKVKNITCASKFFQREVNVELTALEDSSNEGQLQNMVIENTTKNASNYLDRIKQTRNSSSGAFQKECSKLNNLTCFEASCKEDSLDMNLGNTVKPEVDSSKPTDNPVTSHTNSIDSDEFADYETFSSSSYDSENYHSAAESTEDPRYLSMQNSPCNLTISVKHDSLTDSRMHFTNSCFKHDDGLSFTESSQIIPSAKPIADNMPNENSTALCMSVDSPTFADNSPGSLGDQLESLPQLDVTMESPESYAKATGNTQPVYAISAFWDEMEKLTINDILQIRMGRCMLPIEEPIITGDAEPTHRDNADTDMVDSINPESAFLDTLDTADSDYCTNLDESKPDRSSCDFSTSDFEEEYWQFINSSRNTSPDQHDKSYQSECTDYVSTGENSDEMGTPVPSEECSGQMFCGSIVNAYNLAVPQQIKKNKSMYDIHARKSMEDLSSQAFWDRSSCKPLEESLKVSDCFEEVSPIMCLTDEQYQISFPKVCEYLFDDNNAKCEVMSVSVFGLQGNYASMTDYTYCTAPNDLALMPYTEEPIPIFSCSRPTVRELTFPKPGCIFLGTNYTTLKDVSPIQIVSKSIFRGMDCKHIDRSFSFSKDLTSLYSVKKICFLDKGPDVWREAEDEEKLADVTDSNVTVVNEGGVLSVTPRMFKEAALWQISMEKNQMPSDYQSIFSTIKQSDMCLVCIAFASWVLRSSDPEAADAWKAALLANVSALSAIQYLRHYMKKKTSPQDE